jgi:hypothetical protein
MTTFAWEDPKGKISETDVANKEGQPLFSAKIGLFDLFVATRCLFGLAGTAFDSCCSWLLKNNRVELRHYIIALEMSISHLVESVSPATAAGTLKLRPGDQAAEEELQSSNEAVTKQLRTSYGSVTTKRRTCYRLASHQRRGEFQPTLTPTKYRATGRRGR